MLRVVLAGYLLAMLAWLGWGDVVPARVLAAVTAIPVVCVLLGWRRRLMATVALVLWLALDLLMPELLLVAEHARWSWAPLAVLVFLIAAPPAPFGALDARGRVDPGAHWRLPSVWPIAAWALLGVFYGISALVMMLDPAWRAGTALTLGAGDWTAPALVSRLGTWAVGVTWLAFVPLALWWTTRPIGWALALCATLLVLPFAGQGLLAAALAMLHALTFAPGWLPAKRFTAGESSDKPAQATVFYDGHCGLCHRWVRFILAEDAAQDVTENASDDAADEASALFELSPLDSAHFQSLVSADERDALPDSIVLREPSGTLRVKSDAVVTMLGHLGGVWRVASWLMRLVPRPVRDVCYDAVARVRLKLFARPTDACPMMPADLRGRFRM